METLYGYADGFVRDDRGTPIMIVKYCDQKTYEIERRINWQTAYKFNRMVDDLRFPIHKLPNVLKPPVWGRFLKMHTKDDSLESSIDAYLFQMKHYRCTHRYTAIYKIGSYYFCHHTSRGYKNLASLKRLL